MGHVSEREISSTSKKDSLCPSENQETHEGKMKLSHAKTPELSGGSLLASRLLCRHVAKTHLDPPDPPDPLPPSYPASHKAYVRRRMPFCQARASSCRPDRTDLASSHRPHLAGLIAQGHIPRATSCRPYPAGHFPRATSRRPYRAGLVVRYDPYPEARSQEPKLSKKT
jgi:hypothetical protein